MVVGDTSSSFAAPKIEPRLLTASITICLTVFPSAVAISVSFPIPIVSNMTSTYAYIDVLPDKIFCRFTPATNSFYVYIDIVSIRYRL